MEESLPKLININDNSIIPINTSMFSLGRSLTCNHVIESMNVSRVHCFITKGDKKYTLIDRSTNGTIVNGEVIKFNASTDLNDGDLIKFGTIVYEFRDNNNHNQNNTTTITTTKTTTKMADEEQKNQPTTSKLNNDDNDKTNDNDNNEELLEKSLNTSLDCRNIEEIADGELLAVAEEFEIPFETNSATTNNDNDSNDKNIDNKEKIIDELKIESKLKKSVENTVDTELTCSICSELFIKAVTLTCSHTFCKYCINEWQKNRKQCPICRQAITTITPTIVLDNLIEHIITNRPEDERESRQQQIKFREEKLSEAGPSHNHKKRRRTQQSHGQQQQRRRRRRIRGGRHDTETITTSNGTVIHIVSDDDDYNDDDDDGDNDSIIDTFDDDFLYDDSDGSYNDDDDDDDDDDFDGSYTGLPGHYYGGYGRCYICGDHGHWANGCPLKRRF